MNGSPAVSSILSRPEISGLVLPLAIFLLFFLLRGPVAAALAKPFEKFSEKTGREWPGEFARAFQKPVRVLIAAVGLYIALRMSTAVPHGGAAWQSAVRCFRSLWVALAAWGLCRLSDGAVALLFEKKPDLQISGVLLPFLSRALRFLITALAVLIIAQEWNYSISGLLAGLGLGGLAFALAAQETISNLFGGLVVFLDKPFSIGDWIKTGEIEGNVEDMSFRSVKIRTFSQAVVTVPNAKLVGGAITNFSRMGKRKVDFTLTLSLETKPETLRSCTEEIREMLADCEGLEPESAAAALDGIGQTGFSLLISFYTVTTDWQEFLRVREEVYYRVLAILEREHAELAVPTQFLRLEQPGENAPLHG